MKWQILVIFSAMLSAATQATAATGPVGVNLAAMHNWDIVVSPDAIASEFYAAEEFRDHFMVGSYEQMRDQIASFIELGFTHFVCQVMAPFDTEAIEAWYREVALAFRPA